MIKVLIDRQIADGMETTYEAAIKETLRAILEAPGYISGASYKDEKDPNHRIIMTNWASVEAWNHWSTSDSRRSVTASIQPILMREERITILSA
ncbi:antibiotic biosynthesis monooxygenase family protein [Parathalassolituus penaei]|uniref:Antibiotic biosynthesis monooxygenase n=1 Tax=Parathalassolituus penaei TaxID=2997323 RepID=A0A9X3ECD4_9GAMM|nr:antibiotic biosynthesis monooxygenase family protein [Parathalassolituus penaei]MCY0964526.1 antibiotic biosynthesis monooxygenase [Parathalassolituus penaei]